MSFPTLDILQTQIAPDLNATKVAEEWFASFASAAEAGDVPIIVGLFLGHNGTPDGFWRDLLALTWDFRTFQGISLIEPFLRDRLASSHPTSFKLTPGSAQLQQPYSDIAWIQALFTFECDAGNTSGLFRIVPTVSGWKAHIVLTVLENVKGFPEKTGHLRDHAPNHGKWAEKRRKESAFEDKDPSVLIIGGSQTGLAVAARLKVLGVSALVVEKTPRVGDEWRNRYETLCLHDPIWSSHLPYLPFPPTWNVYTPAAKLAGWLESYAQTMELNVWTSSKVTKAVQDVDNRWHVTVESENGTERVFKVNHLVFATGFTGLPRIPEVPGLDEFKGQVIHSTQHQTAANNIGKKVVIIGSCTSGHDICADHVHHGIDVTMIQRGPTYIISISRGIPMIFSPLYSEDGPPTDLADFLSLSYPPALSRTLDVRKTHEICEVDKELLDGLRNVGFRLNERGYEGAGLLGLIWTRGGGYYLDTGSSQLVIDGKIKLKGESIQRITATGIAFEDGSEVPADIIVFGTGYADKMDLVAGICGEDVRKDCKSTDGYDAEGERAGIWRDLGKRGLWYGSGGLAHTRYYSKMLAMQIKAMDEGLLKERYSLL